MKQGIALAVVAGMLAVFTYLLQTPAPEQQGIDTPPVANADTLVSPAGDSVTGAEPERAVLDISVHSEEALRVLLDRAEQFARKPRPAGEEANIVLILHGPEVEFFSINNYDKYKDLVDQAARLDAFDVVDVKICQTMMKIRGIERDDIPAFIEQVPLGPAEVDRLIREGYVYF
ncbi:MAG: DsrE family protein [Pseudomonadota bacterium]|nr:DsrE family protein [Pseudomonadota bacterium]